MLGSVVLDEPLKYNELRYSIDDSNQSLGKKIADAEKMKIPVILIVGPKDEQAKQVSVRVSGKEDKVDLDKLQDWLNKQ